MEVKRVIRSYAVFAALLLASSCISEDVEPLPEVNGEVVYTQFTIAFPSQPSTRMATDIVQQSGDLASFRGMEDIWLLPFQVVTDGTVTAAAGSTRAGSAVSLLRMRLPMETSVSNSVPASGLIPWTRAVLFSDVAIPQGTNAFLFYGHATDERADATMTVAERHRNGVLLPTGLGGADLAAVRFSLQPIATTATLEADGRGAHLVRFLNGILPALAPWAASSDPALRELYTNFIDLHAGASADIQSVVQSLYTSMYIAEPRLGVADKAVANAIMNAITADYDGIHYATASGSTLTFDATVSGYPADLGLPDGAVYVERQSDGLFHQVFDQSWMGLNGAAVSSFTYPPSLYYRGNSRIKTSATSQADHYGGAWETVLGYYDNEGEDATNGAVGAATLSVAIRQPVQYAVGRMDLNVQTATTTLEDYNGLAITTGFPLTGVLVAGQRQVDWQFVPVAAAAEQVIYDSDIPAGTTIPMASDARLCTLVLPTSLANVDGDEVVRFALELRNHTGRTFCGADGALVPPGCKFYLVGELDPKTAAGYVADDAVRGRTFSEDHATTVNVTIRDLKSAYNIVPDLRLARLAMSAHVDLNWQVGHHDGEHALD